MSDIEALRSCRGCLKRLAFGDFGVNKFGRNGLRSKCKVCVQKARTASRTDETRAAERAYAAAHPEQMKASQLAYCERNREKRSASTMRWNKANPERARENFLRTTRVTGWAKFAATKAKLAARRRGWKFDIDADFVSELFHKQGGRCHWLGIELKTTTEHRGPERPSLDRLDISRGYTRDNVVLACVFANLGRSTLTAERFQEFITANCLGVTTRLD